MGADEYTRVSVNHEVNSRRNMSFGETYGFQRSVAEKVWRKWVEFKISSDSKYTKKCTLEVKINLYV